MPRSVLYYAVLCWLVNLRQITNHRETVQKNCIFSSEIVFLFICALTVISNHSTPFHTQIPNSLWIPQFSENYKASDSKYLSIPNIYLPFFPSPAHCILWMLCQLTTASWISGIWSSRTLKTLYLNKKICKRFWPLLHSTVTLMSVKGQSHISFLPWRINNVVTLAETGTSDHRQAVHYFQISLLPKVLQV